MLLSIVLVNTCIALYKTLKVTAIVLLLFSDCSDTSCLLRKFQSSSGYFKDGDVFLGGIFQLFKYHKLTDGEETLQYGPVEKLCVIPSLRFLRHFLAFDFAVQEINNDRDLLPNTTLGYLLYDTCNFEDKAQEAALNILSGGNMYPLNYNCKKNTVAAFIGHLLSSVTLSVANLLNIYGYNQISYGATDINIRDKVTFPSLFHTGHSANVYNKAIIALLKHFGWTWIGILLPLTDTKTTEIQHFIEDSNKNGICIEFILQTKLVNVTATLLKYTTKIIVIFFSEGQLMSIIAQFSVSLQLRDKILIFSTDPQMEYNFKDISNAELNRTFVFLTADTDITGFKESVYEANPTVYKDNNLLETIWLTHFRCLPPGYNVSARYLCKTNYSLRSVTAPSFDLEGFQTTYNVYISVYAIAHALHNMYISEFKARRNDGLRREQYLSRQLNKYLRRLHFKTPKGNEFSFHETENANVRLVLVQNVMFPNKSIMKNHVGEYLMVENSKPKLLINDTDIIWPQDNNEVPLSMCSEQCPPGFRKSTPEQIICCYSCVQCSASEISNQTDMENCLQCPSDEYPDAEQVICLPRTVLFLSYTDPVGATLASFAIILLFITAVILGIFISHRNTPIVRANNRYLSYITLTSLMLSFSSSLLFIGSPSNISCLLQNVFFSIIFAIAVSSVLAKTITVLVAFSIVKPGSKLRIFLGFKVSMFIVILGSFGEVGICSWWLTLWPPYPDKDSKTEASQLILHCNVGSYLFFYIALGYNWFLALICFVVAFLAKQLPDLFNEARYITFSMLVFCSVWVSFIPAYISTKGKNVIAVEIFAILASSTGVVGCIFFPKCFIIMLRPELNIKQNMCITN